MIAPAQPFSVQSDGVSISNEREPLTIDELICQRAEQPGCNEPIFAYASSGTEYLDYTPKQLNELANKAASFYAGKIPRRRHSDAPLQVIALLGASHIGYLATVLGISRLGHTVLFLSTRISDEAYTFLLSNTKATTILVDHAYEKTANAVQSRLPTLKISSICTASQLQLEPSRLLSTRCTGEREQSNTAWIIHSSGSTSLPKPIYQTHKAALKNYSNGFKLCGFVTLPLFHAHGLSCTFRAIYAKKKIYMYNANLPLANQHLIKTLKDHRDIRIFYGVPYALKLMGESEEGTAVLAGLDIVMFGGSACPKLLGDRLVAAGVNLVSHYGSTETGQLMTSFRPREDKDWDYVRAPKNLLPFLRVEPQGGGGLFELCVNEGWPSKVTSNRDDGSYATKDLFESHPTLPNAWRYYARKDDTIVLVNGEKANPLHVEGVAREDFRVAEAIVFGSNRPRLGMFLVSSRAAGKLSEEDLINVVWPDIEKANLRMPAYGQLSKDMIRVLPFDTNYRRTDKGTVIRAAFYRDFSQQIETVYRDAEMIGGDLVLSREDLIAWLKATVMNLAGFKDPSVLQDTTDLFTLGVDSLQSTRMRAFIASKISTGGKALGQNFVFDFPTPAGLADELLRLQSGMKVQALPSVEDRMEAMIAKYSSFKPHIPRGQGIDNECIVVTDATGSLGAHLVAYFARLPSIKTVYCLVRAASHEAASKRVEKSLRDRGIYDDISAKSLPKIIAISSRLQDAKLGLDNGTYDNVTNTLSSVIHAAWSVNFNLALESFEGECVSGTKNLIDLCLQARRLRPASFNFCSSVSTVARTPPGEIVQEALPTSLSYAQNMGYAQSKLVTEHICGIATKKTGITTRVLRVGQIIGDTSRGIWNSTEAIPLILQTADTIGKLPSLDESLSWLPVNIVADAILDVVLCTMNVPVVNIVNHHTFHWTKDLLPLLRAAGLKFEEVDPREWLRQLRASDPDPASNPPIKLLEFFSQKYDRDSPSLGLQYSSTIAQFLSPALRNAKAIDADHVAKFMRYLCAIWRHTQPSREITAH